MSRNQNDTFACGATKISLAALGASVFPTTITPPSGCVGVDLQWLSGGSAMILPNALSGKTISGATTPAGIEGFMLPAAIPYSVPGNPMMYLACGSSTTSVIGVNFRYSANGASLV